MPYSLSGWLAAAKRMRRMAGSRVEDDPAGQYQSVSGLIMR